MREAEPLCAENMAFKDIAHGRRGGLISRGEREGVTNNVLQNLRHKKFNDLLLVCT